jgi:hypothetical protein
MAQAVEHLHCKHKTLNSNLNPMKKKKEENFGSTELSLDSFRMEGG